MKQIKLNKPYIIISSFIFAIFIVLGYSYEKTNSWNLIFASWEAGCISLLQVVISFLLLLIILHIIVSIVKWYANKKFKQTKLNKFFSKHTFMVSILVMLIGWGIYIVAFYPTIITIDAYNQLKAFFGLKNYYTDASILLSENMLITNHHPVLHTLLLGGAVNLGKLISNGNLGLFSYSILQIGILASTFAYSLKYLKQNGVKNRFIYLALLIYTFVPIFPFYAMTATKDVLYTAFVVLLIIEIHKIITQNAKLNIKRIIYLIVLSLLVCLMRNNGIAIAFFVWLILLFYSKENRKRIGIILLTFTCLFIIYLQVVLPYFQIAQVSKREVLSIPFQQTARYIKTYEKEVTPEEKEAINKVLKYDVIKENYTPNISDPVKGTYNKYASKEDLKEYFNVWKKQFKKHPGVYIEATINNIYGYFFPSLSDDYIYYQDINHPLLKIIANYGYMNYNEKFMDYGFNTNLEKTRTALVKIAKKFQYMPILGGIVNIALNNWIVIMLAIYLIVKKKGKYLIVLLPSIISIAICIISPVNNCFRYAMPIIFANPLIILLMINQKT